MTADQWLLTIVTALVTAKTLRCMVTMTANIYAKQQLLNYFANDVLCNRHVKPNL